MTYVKVICFSKNNEGDLDLEGTRFWFSKIFDFNVLICFPILWCRRSAVMTRLGPPEKFFKIRNLINFYSDFHVLLWFDSNFWGVSGGWKSPLPPKWINHLVGQHHLLLHEQFCFAPHDLPTIADILSWILGFYLKLNCSHTFPVWVHVPAFWCVGPNRVSGFLALCARRPRNWSGP